jgi:hypothetical protein
MQPYRAERIAEPLYLIFKRAQSASMSGPSRVASRIIPAITAASRNVAASANANPRQKAGPTLGLGCCAGGSYQAATINHPFVPGALRQPA